MLFLFHGLRENKHIDRVCTCTVNVHSTVSGMQQLDEEELEPQFTVYNGSIAGYKRIVAISTGARNTQIDIATPPGVAAHRRLDSLRLVANKSHVDEHGRRTHRRIATRQKRALLRAFTPTRRGAANNRRRFPRRLVRKVGKPKRLQQQRRRFAPKRRK